MDAEVLLYGVGNNAVCLLCQESIILVVIMQRNMVAIFRQWNIKLEQCAPVHSSVHGN